MKIIELGNGLKTKVDDDDFIALARWNWKPICCNGITYAARHSSSGTVYMHREVKDATKGKYVDHINHDTLDNQKGNLRICSQSQNMANARRPSHNTSGYKGVHFHKKAKKYSASMQIHGKSKHLGLFLSAVEAAKAYNKAALSVWGDFAYINEVEI